MTEIVKGKKYRIELSAGKDPVTGKYRKVRETFLGTRRQAQLRIEEIRRELESGKRPDADKITFADWCEQYLANREAMGKHRPKTLQQDRSLSKHLLRGLGAALVVDVTPATVNGLYSSMRKAGVGDTTLKQAHKLLKRIMADAVNNDLIMRNPVDRVDAPRKPKPQRHALTSDEADRLIAACAAGAPSANATAVYLGLATGARLGEVMGLTWGHVCLEGDRPFVHVVQQFTSAGEVAPLNIDKDDNPVGRVVPIDGSTVAALATWKSAQRRQLNKLGIEQGGDTPVVTNQVGGFTNHSRFQRWWRAFCVENGFGRWVDGEGREIVELTVGEDVALHPGCRIEWRDGGGWPCDERGRRFSRTYKRPEVRRHYDGLHFHELRHTHFTMRLASGMDLIMAQALGGWSSPDVLMTVYAHPVAENVWASAGFMDDLAAKREAAV